MANDFSKFISIMFALLFAMLLAILPGLIFVWIWAALRAVGLGVLWILLIIFGLLLLLTIPIFNMWRGLSRHVNGFC